MGCMGSKDRVTTGTGSQTQWFPNLTQCESPTAILYSLPQGNTNIQITPPSEPQAQHSDSKSGNGTFHALADGAPGSHQGGSTNQV